MTDAPETFLACQNASYPCTLNARTALRACSKAHFDMLGKFLGLFVAIWQVADNILFNFFRFSVGVKLEFIIEKIGLYPEDDSFPENSILEDYCLNGCYDFTEDSILEDYYLNDCCNRCKIIHVKNFS